MFKHLENDDNCVPPVTLKEALQLYNNIGDTESWRSSVSKILIRVCLEQNRQKKESRIVIAIVSAILALVLGDNFNLLPF